jgi:energy-coupling factor transporter ATP-binding protein EcfA2
VRITEIRIEGFRSIRDVTVSDLPDLTLIVGANNTGKSNVVSALKYLRTSWIGGPSFAPTDFCAFSELPECKISVSVSLEKGELRQSYPGAAQMLGTEQRTIRSIFEPFETQLDRWTLVSSFEPQANAGVVSRRECILKGKLQFPQSVTINGNPVDSKNLITILSQAVGIWVSSRINVLGPTRRPSPSVGAIPQDTLADDASNLANALYRHWGAHDPQFNELQAWVREIFPSVESVVLVPSSNGPITLGIKEKGVSIIVPLDAMSSGITQAIAILALIALAPDGSLVTIEEPEAHFNPASLALLMKRLVVESPRTRMIIATHSTDILNRIDIGPDVWQASRGERGDTVLQRLNKIEYIGWLSQSLEGVSPGAPGTVPPRQPPAAESGAKTRKT